MNELRGILQAIGVSDVKMEEGSFRIDANVSLRPVGATELGTKVEVKNMNSIRSLGRALEYEIERQIERRWTPASASCRRPATGTRTPASPTRCARRRVRTTTATSPSPTSSPWRPTVAMRERVRAGMPELPAAARARLVSEWGIGEHEARVLIGTPGLAEFAEAAVVALQRRHAEGRRELVHRRDARVPATRPGSSPGVLPLAPDGLAELVDLVADGTLSRNLAKDVLAECLREPKRPKQVVEERGLAQVSDEGELASIVDEIIAAHPDVVADYRAGDDKSRKKKRGFLMGEAMKATKGQGNPQLLNRLLDTRLS